MVATDEDACHVNLPLCHVNLPLCHVSRRHTRFQSHQRRGALLVKLSTALVVELSTALVVERSTALVYHHQYMHSTALPAFVA